MARPKQDEMPGIEGPGVTPPKFKDLDRLADRFIDVRDQKSELASDLTKIEAQIAEKMDEHGLEKYAFSDQVVELKKGKVHIKVKMVKSEGVSEEK